MYKTFTEQQPVKLRTHKEDEQAELKPKHTENCGCKTAEDCGHIVEVINIK